MKTFSLFLSVILLRVMCSKDMDNNNDVPSACQLKATVVETSNMDCGKPLLSFEDTTTVKQIAGRNLMGLFLVDQLPDNLNVSNKKLLVCIRALKTGESFMCTTYGPGYPAVKLVSAQARD